MRSRAADPRFGDVDLSYNIDNTATFPRRKPLARKVLPEAPGSPPRERARTADGDPGGNDAKSSVAARRSVFRQYDVVPERRGAERLRSRHGFRHQRPLASLAWHGARRQSAENAEGACRRRHAARHICVRGHCRQRARRHRRVEPFRRPADEGMGRRSRQGRELHRRHRRLRDLGRHSRHRAEP